MRQSRSFDENFSFSSLFLNLRRKLVTTVETSWQIKHSTHFRRSIPRPAQSGALQVCNLTISIDAHLPGFATVFFEYFKKFRKISQNPPPINGSIRSPDYSYGFHQSHLFTVKAT
jgi:hypothetical protein